MAGFERATKTAARLRLAISAPAGAGKTYTALALATGLAGGLGVALIDTEHGSAAKYADRFTFDTMRLGTYHPQGYIDAINLAETAGYSVLVIDSLSHAWSGTGGLLEEKDAIAKRQGGNSFSAWRDASAIQNRLVNAILGCQLHVIATLRSKMDYVLDRDDRTGRTTPRKVGLAPVQRDDIPYEFDLFCTMDVENTLIVEKSRCPDLTGAVIPKPGQEMVATLARWLGGAAPVPSVDDLKSAMLSVARQWDEGLPVVRDRCLGELGLSGAVSDLGPEQREAVWIWCGQQRAPSPATA